MRDYLNKADVLKNNWNVGVGSFRHWMCDKENKKEKYNNKRMKEVKMVKWNQETNVSLETNQEKINQKLKSVSMFRLVLMTWRTRRIEQNKTVSVIRWHHITSDDHIKAHHMQDKI